MTLLSLSVPFLILAVCLWLMLCFYGVCVCSLPRGFWKKFFKIFDLVLFLIVLPTTIFLTRNTFWMQQVLNLQPQDFSVWFFLFILAAILTYGLLCQAHYSLRLFFPRTISQLEKISIRKAYFQPRVSDWQILRDKNYTDQPTIAPADARPMPRFQREVKPVKPHFLSPRLTLHPLYRAIDQSFDLRIKEMNLQWPDLPQQLHGLRILQIADSHMGTFLPPAYFEHLVEQAQALQPDLILFTGDFTADDNLYMQSVRFFAKLQAPMGKWAVRGNHDYYGEPELLGYWMEHYGIELLCNRSVDLHCDAIKKNDQGRRAILRLTGIEHPYQKVPDYRDLFDIEKSDREKSADNSRAFHIVISHEPDNFPRLARYGVDLVLCGHTHGGQWRVPGIGPLVVPSRYGRRYDYGLHSQGRSLLYTTSGCGLHTIPLRLNCPPEITVFRLLRNTKKNNA